MEKLSNPMSAGGAERAAAWPQWPGLDMFRQASEYWFDSWQRSVLFLDVLRRRGNEHAEYIAQKGPNVLSFPFELIMDGRTLDRPVNYCLVRIVPPQGVEIDPQKRPFVVFDPRAGHGPGIGGMKHESEIGVALEAGHPCYFVGFLPDPVSGQTIEDVCHAEARFLERVAALHPDAEGKPCLIGNCQAGWQIMMMAAARPDLVGPLVLAGAPLSYWAGVHGKHPLRYLGGLLGGTWLTSLAGDLGNGIFDGANLVANFESMNPSNTLWKKDYHVYSNIDSEAGRFLEFEKWWGSPVLLNAQEMQFIADELFIGNKLSDGEMFMSDGVRIDLRNIQSPIVVFCSWGDDITSPQQALDWVLDIYDSDEALVAGGQTIVYALHQSIGHLGIFVSAKVATKEHEEFARTMDLIDALPPGLYEAVFTEKSPEIAHAELVSGDYLVQFERRSLDDLRAFGGNDEADDRRFATVARLSEINQGLYRTFLSPLVQAATSAQSAEWLRRFHPHRVRFELFSDKNPWMRSIEGLADSIRSNRKPAAPDNPLLALQEKTSERIVDALDRYRDMRDRATEAFFLGFYGSPAVQAMTGLRSDQATAHSRIGRDVARETAGARAVADLDQRIEQGGPIEAGLRALIYVDQGRPHQAVDERVFAALRQLRQQHPECRRLGLARFKEIVREQYLLLRHDEERALAAIPGFLPDDPAERQSVLDAVRQAIEASGELPDAVRQRLARIEALFETRLAGDDIRQARGRRRQVVADAAMATKSSNVTATQAGQPRSSAAE
ncbi:MAG TPA: DUF3141 domain-containing protein [Aliidongia sp.]|nr:DUF3141 domain-containing protein [Aliidongia sp.]